MVEYQEGQYDASLGPHFKSNKATRNGQMWSSLDQKGGFLPELLNLNSSKNFDDGQDKGRNGRLAQSMALKNNTNQSIAE